MDQDIAGFCQSHEGDLTHLDGQLHVETLEGAVRRLMAFLMASDGQGDDPRPDDIFVMSIFRRRATGDASKHAHQIGRLMKERYGALATATLEVPVRAVFGDPDSWPQP